MATQAKVVAEMDLSLIGSDVVDLLLVAGGGYGSGGGGGGGGGFVSQKIKLVPGSHTFTIGGNYSNSYFTGPSGAIIAYKGGIGGTGALYSSVGSQGGANQIGLVNGYPRQETGLAMVIGPQLGQGHQGWPNAGAGGGGAGGESTGSGGGPGRTWIDGVTYAAGGGTGGHGAGSTGNGGGGSGYNGGSGIGAIAYVGTTDKFTGGSVSQVGSLRIHYFTTSTTFTI